MINSTSAEEHAPASRGKAHRSKQSLNCGRSFVARFSQTLLPSIDQNLGKATTARAVVSVA